MINYATTHATVVTRLYEHQDRFDGQPLPDLDATPEMVACAMPQYPAASRWLAASLVADQCLHRWYAVPLLTLAVWAEQGGAGRWQRACLILGEPVLLRFTWTAARGYGGSILRIIAPSAPPYTFARRELAQLDHWLRVNVAGWETTWQGLVLPREDL